MYKIVRGIVLFISLFVVLHNTQVYAMTPIVSIDSAQVSEANNFVALTISISEPQSSKVSVDFETEDVTAISGQDYVARSLTTVNFAAGQTSKVRYFSILDDTNTESDETFQIRLSNPVGVSIFEPVGIVTIQDNDSTATIDINSVQVDESAQNAILTISLSQPQTQNISVDFETQDGTAVSGSDFEPRSISTITFAPGQTTKVRYVSILDDNLAEGQETFQVVLSNPVGATIAQPISTITIEDNDFSASSISINSVSVDESDQTAALTVSLSQPQNANVRVDFETVDGSAVAGQDYVARELSTMNFAPGQTSKVRYVSILNDDLAENSENLQVRLSNAVGATILEPIGDITILDDDSAVLPSVSISSTDVSESNQQARLTISLSEPQTTKVSVDFETLNGSAIAGQDYVARELTTINFAAGQTSKDRYVTILDDALVEGDESFEVGLSNPDGIDILESTGVITILDNDVDVSDDITCGAPVIDRVADKGPWLWRECDSPDGVWQLRLAGGSSDNHNISGSFTSDQAIIDIEEINITNTSEIDLVSDDTLGFTIITRNTRLDGLELTFAEGSNNCLDLYGIDASRLKLGKDAVSAPVLPINLGTLESCLPEVADDALSFLVVLTDDQRFDSTWVMQETKQKLFDKSVVFENAFITTPLCCPARASVLSGGFYPYNTGVFMVIGDNGGENSFRGAQDRDTIATSLQGMGYKTAYTGGKYLNDYRPPYIPPGWDLFLNNVQGPSSGRWFDYDTVTGSSGITPSIGEVNAVNEYVTDHHAGQLLNFLDSLEDDDAFLAFYSVFAPHNTATPHPDDQVPGIVIDGIDLDSYVYRGRAHGETDLSDKPDWLANPNRFFSAKAGHNGLDDDGFHRNQLRSLLSVDRAVGDLVDKIESLGRLDNTVIIFLSDNGFMWGEHGVYRKGMAYEESSKVPFSIYLPGIEPRIESKIVSANLDLGATIHSLAGANKPSEGLDLTPLLNDTAAPWREELLLQGWGSHEGANGTWSAVRTDEWKYIENSIGEIELYDMVNDEYETESLHDDPNFDSVKNELAEIAENQRGLGVTVHRAPSGLVNTNYSFQLTAWGGNLPYHWSVYSGELPDGVSLDSATGLISGTPTIAGSYDFKILLTDNSVRPKTGEPQSFFAPGRSSNNYYTIVVEE